MSASLAWPAYRCLSMTVCNHPAEQLAAMHQQPARVFCGECGRETDRSIEAPCTHSFLDASDEFAGAVECRDCGMRSLTESPRSICAHPFEALMIDLASWVTCRICMDPMDLEQLYSSAHQAVRS